MKKTFFISLLFGAILFASCSNGVEEKAKGYLEDLKSAENAQDYDRCDEIFTEYTNWTETLSESEQQSISDIAGQITQRYIVDKTFQPAEEMYNSPEFQENMQNAQDAIDQAKRNIENMD